MFDSKRFEISSRVSCLLLMVVIDRGLKRALCVYSMHRHQRPLVRAVEPGPPLPEPQGPVHQLHLRGRQPGTDVVAGRTPGPEFFATHTRGDRLRVDHARGRQQNSVAPTADHPGPDAVQTGRQRGRVLAHGHVVENEQSRIARAQR